jgi:hypothetical protein
MPTILRLVSQRRALLAINRLRGRNRSSPASSKNTLAKTPNLNQASLTLSNKTFVPFL